MIRLSLAAIVSVLACLAAAPSLAAATPNTLPPWAQRLVPDRAAVNAAVLALDRGAADGSASVRGRALADAYFPAIEQAVRQALGTVEPDAVRRQIDEFEEALRKELEKDDTDQSLVTAQRSAVELLRRRVDEAEIRAAQAALLAAEQLADGWMSLAQEVQDSDRQRTHIERTGRRLRIGRRLETLDIAPHLDRYPDFARPIDLVALVRNSAAGDDTLGLALRRMGVDAAGPTWPHAHDPELLAPLDAHDDHQSTWLAEAARQFVAVDAQALTAGTHRASLGRPAFDANGRREAFVLQQLWSDAIADALVAAGGDDAVRAWRTRWSAAAAPKLCAPLWLESEAQAWLTEASRRHPAIDDRFNALSMQMRNQLTALGDSRLRAFAAGARFSASEGLPDAGPLSASYAAAVGQLRALHNRAVDRLVESVTQLDPDEGAALRAHVTSLRTSEPWRFGTRPERRSD